MQNKNIIHHWGFRLLTPPIFALFIYVLVLLFFDSPGQLLTHFFSIEYFICVALCYLNFGAWRFIIKKCENWCLKSLKKGIILQGLFTILSSVLLTALLLIIYFRLVVGFVHFQSELIIFCSLMVLSALLYNMVYFSQFLLDYQHHGAIAEQEKLKHQAMEQWENYQNRINPALLYQSLERLIGLAYNNKEKADEFLSQLAKLYRKVLDNYEDVIPIEQELEHLQQLNTVFSELYNNEVAITIKTTNLVRSGIVPGLLLLQVQKIVSENIVNELQPLTISIENKEHLLILTYTINKKLNPEKASNIYIDALQKKQDFYTHSQIKKEKNGNVTHLILPLIKME